MNTLATIIVVGFGLFLIGFAGAALTKSEIAEQFVMAFASLARGLQPTSLSPLSGASATADLG
jgi:hypothetical protein